MPARFCEESLCAWIRQPGNTWSNAGFLIAAAIVWLATRAPEQRHLRPMAWVLAAMGVGSAFFHATETEVGAWLDYATMYMSTAFMIVVIVKRSAGISRPFSLIVFWTLVALGTSTMLIGSGERWIFAATNFACPIGEGVLALRRSTRAKSYRWFFFAYAAFTPAVIFWALDQRGLLCDPDNHFMSGHAAWHLLDALMFWCSFRYYQQFDQLRRP
jgi:hypothetical protein